MAHMRNQFRRIIVGKQDLKRVYQGLDDLKNPMEVWSGLATYEKSNSILEYMWRQYNLETNYRWDRSNIIYTQSSTSNPYEYLKRLPSGAMSSYTFNSSNGTYSLSGSSVSYGTGYVIWSGVMYRYVETSYGDSEGGYRHDVTKYTAIKGKGSSAGTVTSSSSTTYPTNGVSGSYYYDNRTSYYVRGTYIKNVTSTNSSAYSTNGITGSYYYDTRTSAYIKGSLIGNVEAEEGTYPTNGRHTDGFWYILIP